MEENQALNVRIGDRVLTCNNGEDALVLQPVGGILCDESIEGYSADELAVMVRTLEKYDRPESLAQLRQLVEAGRKAR